MWKLRILLKRPAPRASVGIGPEIKTDFSQLRRRLKSFSKSFFVSSDCWRAVSFDPTWTISLLTDDGSECSSPGSLSRITGTVAPGRQRVAALKNRMFLIMESPIMNVVGANRGRGGAGD